MLRRTGVTLAQIEFHSCMCGTRTAYVGCILDFHRIHLNTYEATTMLLVTLHDQRRYGHRSRNQRYMVCLFDARIRCRDQLRQSKEKIQASDPKPDDHSLFRGVLATFYFLALYM